MPKALELSAETMTAPPVPKAAQITSPAPAAAPEPRSAKKPVKAEIKEPLQVRWPVDEVKAVKLAALQMDFPTVSEFMLACFHAYMKTTKEA